MKRAVAVLALALGACSEKKEPTAPVAPTAPPVALKPMREREVGAPVISLSINGSLKPVITRGWPAWATADVDPPGAKLVVEGWTEAPGGWGLTAAQTAAIPAGKHRVGASAGALRVEVEVDVRDEPAALTAEELAEKRRAQAAALRSAGNWDGLLALAKEAGSPEWEGDALAGLGRKEEAAAAYGEALKRFRKEHPQAKEPPALLWRKLVAARGF